jgi:hypothetical protein
MNKVYYFINDYTTKYGVVKKGDSLTGSITPKGVGKIVFEFFEKTDKAKAEAGQGSFSIVESDLKKIATDVAPTTTDTKGKDDAKTTDDLNRITNKGFRSWSGTKKAVVVGSGLAVLGLAVWFFVIRKK